MCDTRNSARIILLGRTIRVDGCIRDKLIRVNKFECIVACCCGHGRYPETIVINNHNHGKDKYYELHSGIEIPRTRNFYKMDSQGYYYIPEVSKEVVE